MEAGPEMAATGRLHRFSLCGYLIVVAAMVYSLSLHAQEDGVAKLLYLVVEEDRIIASNVHFSRFDELQLSAKEQIAQKTVADAVAIVATNQRLLAYGAFAAGWRSERLKAGERVQSIEAQDYSATVVTSDRILNFNGRNGVWAETRR